MDKIVVQQDQEFRVAVIARSEDNDGPHQITHIDGLSPYTMILASLGLCTGIVMHTYA